MPCILPSASLTGEAAALGKTGDSEISGFGFTLFYLYHFTILDFSSMMTRRGILKNWQFIATTMPVSSLCPSYWVSFTVVLFNFEITEEGTGYELQYVLRKCLSSV